MTFKELAVGTLKVNMASVSSQGSTDIFTKKKILKRGMEKTGESLCKCVA